MNTGIQRSGGTPLGAATTTSPGGEAVPGKPQFQKDLVGIMHAHDIPVYTASISHPQDLMQKVQQALLFEGPAFMMVDAPCTLGWKVGDKDALLLSKLAIETCIYPVFSAYKDKWELSAPSRKIALNPDFKKPVEEYIKVQGRFKHLFRPVKNQSLIDKMQKLVDEKWERLLKKVEHSK